MEHGAADCFREFQRLVLQHAAANPPESLAIFKVSEAKLLTDFAAATFFKHLLLYQFCMNCPQDSAHLGASEEVGWERSQLGTRQSVD